jgi:hypothetical protein
MLSYGSSPLRDALTHPVTACLPGPELQLSVLPVSCPGNVLRPHQHGLSLFLPVYKPVKSMTPKLVGQSQSAKNHSACKKEKLKQGTNKGRSAFLPQ